MFDFLKKKQPAEPSQEVRMITTAEGIVIPEPIRYKKKHRYEWWTHLIIVGVLLFVFIPVYIMLSTSVMSRVESQSSKFHWIPNDFSMEAYIHLLTAKSDITF